jgi:hypothetical protein
MIMKQWNVKFCFQNGISIGRGRSYASRCSIAADNYRLTQKQALRPCKLYFRLHSSSCHTRNTLSVLSAVHTSKLSDFYLWRHTWRIKLNKLRSNAECQNCPFQSCFTLRTAQGIHQFPQFTCPNHDGIISRPSAFQNEYIPIQIPILTAHFTLSFVLLE